MSLLPLFSLPNSHQHCPVATTTQCCVPYCAGGEEGEGIAGIPAVLIMRTNNDDAEREREKGGELLPKVFFSGTVGRKRKEGNDWPACPVRPAMLLLPRADGRSDELFWSSFFFFRHARRRNHQKFLVCWGGSRRRFLVLHKVGRRSDGRLRRRSPPATRGTDRRRRRRRHMLCVHWAVDMVGDVDDCWEEESE